MADLNGDLPNKIARMQDGLYIYAFDEDTLHKMEVKDNRVLWTEPIEQEVLDERERQVREALSTNHSEFGKEPNGEDANPKENFRSENQGNGCSQIDYCHKKFGTDN